MERPGIVAKNKQADLIASLFKTANSLIIFEYHGLNVPVLEQMRKDLYSIDTHLHIYKNRIFQRAVASERFKALTEFLTGPNAFAFVNADTQTTLQILAKTAKAFPKKFKFKGGVIDEAIVDGNMLKQLAFLPSKSEMIGMFANALLFPLRSFMMTVKAIADKQATA